VHIETVLRPGDLGQIVTLHARQYAQLAGFGFAFEALVAADLAAFVRQTHLGSRIWLARAGGAEHAEEPGGAGEAVGCIAIDRSHDARAAHLRWFLLAPAYRGIGLGRRLLGQALRFCDDNAVRDTTPCIAVRGDRLALVHAWVRTRRPPAAVSGRLAPRTPAAGRG
jgi:GNAT superfamily N-acetyltransferase